MRDNLTARGYRVSIAQNPLASLEDDAAVTELVLDQQGGPTVLAGHSWDGTGTVFDTVCSAAQAAPRVAGSGSS